MKTREKGGELKYTRTGTSTTETGWQTDGKAEANSSGPMETTMKETGKTTKLQEKEKWSM